MENGGEGGGGCNFESILDIEYESNNRIVLPRFSLNGESKLGGWAVTRAIHGAIPALRFLYRRFPPPPFFEPSQGMGLTTSYKNVVRVSLHLQGFTISPKKSRSFGYACRGKNNAIRRKSRGWFMREGSRVEGKVNLTLDYPVFWINTARVTDLSTFPLVILLQKLLGKLRDVQKLIAETVWKTCCWKVTIASCIIVSIVIIYSRLLDYF